jgi:hypothetical protein
MWHLLAPNSTAGSPKVLCNAPVKASPWYEADKLTRAAFVGLAGLSWPIICQDCASLVTSEMLHDELEQLPEPFVRVPAKRKYPKPRRERGE